MSATPDPTGLAARFRATFPTEPIPPYPANFGHHATEPRDEYEMFIDRPWNEVPPTGLTSIGFDISAAVAFSLQEPPHLWNYYLPAFAVGALLFESDDDIEILFDFLLQLRRCPPRLGPVDPALPWWHGAGFCANYDAAQCDCVIAFFEFVRGYGAVAPWWHDWEPTDELVLEAFRARRAML